MYIIVISLMKNWDQALYEVLYCYWGNNYKL